MLLLCLLGDKCIVCKWLVEVVKRCYEQGTLITEMLSCHEQEHTCVRCTRMISLLKRRYDMHPFKY